MQKTKRIISVNSVSKIFGDDPKRAQEYIASNYTRDEIKNATNQLVALRNISFEVNSGEIFVLMGLSGSGKSTLLRCLNQLHKITYGSIHIDNTDITSLSSQKLRQFRRQQFGMVFQHFALFPHRNVLENVVFGLEIQGINKKEREATGYSVLQTVGLEKWAYNRMNELSGGMQQRVGLARALAIDPAILLMDEPFSALDPLIRTDLQDELISIHNTTKKTILFVTHDLNEAIKIGDRIAILNAEGQISQIDDPESILLHPADAYVETFLNNVDRSAVIRAESVMQPADHSVTYHEYINQFEPIKTIIPNLLQNNNPIGVITNDNTVCGQITRQDIVTVLTANKK